MVTGKFGGEKGRMCKTIRARGFWRKRLFCHHHSAIGSTSETGGTQSLEESWRQNHKGKSIRPRPFSEGEVILPPSFCQNPKRGDWQNHGGRIIGSGRFLRIKFCAHGRAAMVLLAMVSMQRRGTESAEIGQED